MHSYLASIKLIIYFLIFQAFFVIKTSYSDHLTAKITGFVDASSPIHILGYDRKYYFEENSAPLFIVVEQDINNFNMINLKAFPHINIGLLLKSNFQLLKFSHIKNYVFKNNIFKI